MIMLALVAFVLLSALPFVPGAEIGFGLLVLFGGKVALAVYGAMVLALTVSFLVGTLVPARWIGRFLGFLGLRRARELVNRLQALPRTQRIDFLIARAPARFVPTLLRHRYLALIIVLNLPGNSLLGGGGGLALAAGMSGVFSLPGFVATVALAVAPVPLVFYFTM